MQEKQTKSSRRSQQTAHSFSSKHCDITTPVVINIVHTYIHTYIHTCAYIIIYIHVHYISSSKHYIGGAQ